MRKLKTFLLALSSLFLLTGCIYDNGNPRNIDTITAINLSQETLTMKVGSAGINITATLVGEGDFNKNIRISSSNIDVASPNVNSIETGYPFLVSPVGEGTCEIICTANGNTSISKKLTVTVEQGQAIISVESVTLDKHTLDLTLGDSYTLSYTIAPTDATNQLVDFESSNPDVVSVSSTGTITALDVGSADVAITTKDGGKTDTCKVTVAASQELVIGNYYLAGSMSSWKADAKYALSKDSVQGLYDDEIVCSFTAEIGTEFKVVKYNGLDESQAQKLTWCTPDNTLPYDDLFAKDGGGNYCGELTSPDNNMKVNVVNEKKAFKLYFRTTSVRSDTYGEYFKYYLAFGLN